MKQQTKRMQALILVAAFFLSAIGGAIMWIGWPRGDDLAPVPEPAPFVVSAHLT